MCNKNPESLQLSSVIKKEISQTFEPIRKIRTKRRKPEFLSLRLTLALEINRESDQMATATTLHHPHNQLNLFPLHPEHLVDEKDAHYLNLESFFAAADGGAATITSLLSGAVTSSEEDTSRASPSLTNTLVGLDGEEVKLVRTALRHKERDASEEKWVSYSEVVERKNEEVTSRAANPPMPCKKQRQGLSLKLDYQKILNAWSDKGPLYVQSEPPQTVPVLPDDFLSDHYSNGLMDVIESDGGLWRVPKKCCSNGSTSKGKLKVKGEVQGGAEWKMGQREASVLRYKEKKQNRLFSKKIRYQVRKLNAEKRPRVMLLSFPSAGTICEEQLKWKSKLEIIRGRVHGYFANLYPSPSLQTKRKGKSTLRRVIDAINFRHQSFMADLI